MSQSAAIGLTAQEVARVFPFHLGFDEHLHIVQLGPSLSKLVPGVALGQVLTERFSFELPHVRAFVGLCRALDVIAVLRVLDTGAQLRGQLVLSEQPRRLLFLCSPWLRSAEELPKLGLQLTDFALHDPKADLLQALRAQEASLGDVRKLMTKLAAQRREERAGGARLTALLEVTRLLAEATQLDEIVERILEQLAAITRFPVVSMWLQDPPRQSVHVVPGATADRCARLLSDRLRATSPDLAVPAWLPIEGSQVRRFAPERAATERSRFAATLGFTTAYRQRIEGAGGALGVFEIYGVQAPGREQGAIDGLSELAIRVGQHLDKSRAEAALRGSIEVAAAAATAKSHFLARMSHELRGPLSGVLGMLDQALSGELPAAQRGQLEMARASGEQLLGRVNDVLDLSQIETARIELAELPFELHACLRRVHNLFGARAAAKHLSLGLLIDPHLPERVCGDELRISQVLVNLIGNAIKFTRAGSVQVDAQLLEEIAGELTVEISVRDTGPGISEARREEIFAAFGGAAGPGLGLAICRQLAELMGGELTVASSPREGSVFRFSVSLRRVTPSAAVQTPQVVQGVG
jgi:signal transduction histidine kinase